MADRRKQLTSIGVVSSAALFGIKLWAGLVSGSTAVMSDALNSLLDIFAYTALYLAVRAQAQAPDLDHHYGHSRAEPLAGFLIAVFAGILGAVIFRDGMLGLFESHTPSGHPAASLVLCISILTKAFLALPYRRAAKKSDSPALRAGYIDSVNDMLASGVALAGVAIGGIWDDVAGLIIGVWILFSGGRIGLENIGYLMGGAPSGFLLDEIRLLALNSEDVVGLNDLRAHYVGNTVHVEIHIEVDRAISIERAHDIAKTVGMDIEALEDISQAFVHVDPVVVN